MLTFKTIEKDTIWIAKMQGYRTSGTYDEVSHLLKNGECRDFDVACSVNQPKHLQKFYEDYEAQFYNKPIEERIFILKDFYPVWAKTQIYLRNAAV